MPLPLHVVPPEYLLALFRRWSSGGAASPGNATHQLRPRVEAVVGFSLLLLGSEHLPGAVWRLLTYPWFGVIADALREDGLELGSLSGSEPYLI